MRPSGQNPAFGAARPAVRAGFTLLEMMLAISLVALLLVGLNSFIFSMGELWGRGADARLFDQHVLGVTRYLEREMRAAILPPFSQIGDNPVAGQEIRPLSGTTDNLLTFTLPEGSRMVSWPDRSLPEVVCSLQARDGEGLVLLWHSKLETKFADDPPRETVLTPYVTALTYDYYDPDYKHWTNETALKKDSTGNLQTPQRLHLKFVYGKYTKETTVTLPINTEGLPTF
jgi:prepilin-type N-terminal cleavage/methylation domain-containing protein